MWDHSKHKISKKDNIILDGNLASEYATVYVGKSKICKCMQSLFSCSQRPKDTYTCSGHSERGASMWILPSCVLSYPNFEIIGQSCNSMSWERGRMQISFCAAELFQKWAVCLTTWERSVSQMQTHASKNPGTPLLAAGIQTSNLQRKAMLVHPAVLTTMLTKFPLHNGFAEVRWLPHYALLVKLQWSGKCGVAISSSAG